MAAGDDVAALTIASSVPLAITSGLPAGATRVSVSLDGATGAAAPVAAIPPIDLSTGLSHRIVIGFEDANQQSLCTRAIRVVVLPGWSDASAQGTLDVAGGSGTFTFSDSARAARLSITLLNSGTQLQATALAGDLGPVSGNHVHVTGDGAFPDNLAFHGSFVDKSGRDVITGIVTGSEAPIAVDSSCAGFIPAIKRPSGTGISGTVAGASLTLKSLSLVCGGVFQLSGQLQLAFPNLRDSTIQLGAQFAATLDGGSPTFSITIPPKNLLMLTDAAGVTVAGLDFKDGQWLLSGALGLPKIVGPGSSSVATIAISGNGVALVGDAPIFALGDVQIAVSSLACTKNPLPASVLKCTGALGLRLPGFTTGTDTPLLLAFDGSTLTTKLTSKTTTRIGVATLEFGPQTAISISPGTFSVTGSSALTIDGAGSSFTVTDFSVTRDTAGTKVNATFSGGKGMQNGLLTLTNLQGTLKKDPAQPGPATLALTADAAISLKTSDAAAAEFTATARGLTARFPLTLGSKPVFSQPDIAKVSASGSIFGRRIEGGCLAATGSVAKTFLSDHGDGTYEICISTHLVPGTSVAAGDVVNTDVTLRTESTADPKKPAFHVSRAVISYNDTNKPLVTHFGGRTLRVNDVAVQYNEDGSTITAKPDFATTCTNTPLSGSLRVSIDGLVNGGQHADPQEMDAAIGFGNECFWFQADGVAAIQLVPTVHAIVYHAEFVHERAPSKPESTPAVASVALGAGVGAGTVAVVQKPATIPMRTYVMAKGDLSYQNYIVSFKRLSYDDHGNRSSSPETHFDVDKGQTALKNVPALAALLGAIAARIAIH